ncbi:fluoride efflux transporter CrcB [Microbacterium sp. TNHR37B]|uniref:fluoride efflux transporter CrcB n=1 Tax=Microbacterium sp. TNHR37B TaxID=1775956 RepID=UPI0007B26B4F|nr:fluoride efflux transporter CrcB [Microbacterium sp. TNHR37B]KZE89568.1 putative fluoride ion transporter CrcB [Microbacterium sp. TNHR37B]
MSGGDFLWLVVGGGVGAGARYLVDGLIMRGRRDAFPVGILVVNVVGSFALGILTGLSPLIGAMWLAIGGIGVLGGFTTFSTVSVETVLLRQRGRAEWAWVNLLGTLGACVVAAAIGLMIGGAFTR